MADVVVAVFWLAVSLATRRFALARVDCAAVRSALSDVVSSQPSVCPAVTCWPGFTATAATDPLTEKATSACCTGVSVPTTCRAAVTFAEVTLASR